MELDFEQLQDQYDQLRFRITQLQAGLSPEQLDQHPDVQLLRLQLQALLQHLRDCPDALLEPGL